MTHEQLMLITKFMPMKTIQVNDEDYLQRYYVGQNEHGDQDWLHRFLRADSERHLHSHPWHADSTILCGWYAEEVKGRHATFRKTWYAGEVNAIAPDRIHRIVDVQPNTWTHMRVCSGRESSWFFINDDDEKHGMQTSPIDWWKECSPRSNQA